MHDKITDMVEYSASLGLQTCIYTSGIVFDEKKQRASINKDLLKSISSKISKLIFNIEAATPSTYDKIMGTTGCFEKMKQSILDAHSIDIRTEAHFVPMKLNIDEVAAVVDLCRDLKVARLSFLRLVLHGRAQDNEALIALADGDLQKFKTVLGELKEQAAVDIRIGVPLSIDKSCHKCEAANGKLNIKYDGSVFPCEVFKNGRISHYVNDEPPDSIHDKPLTEIYNSSVYLSTVRKLSTDYHCSSNRETCVGQYLLKSEGVDNYD